MKPVKNQIWKDNDSSILRFIQITGKIDDVGHVEVTTIVRSSGKYELPKTIENGMITYPRADRFNGKSGGYSFVASNMKEFNAQGMRLLHYADRIAKKPIAEAVQNKDPQIEAISVFDVPSKKPVVGEIWRELKGTCCRYVQVVSDEHDGKIKIVTRYFTDKPGSKPSYIEDARPTMAMESRFNSKQGGYEYTCRNLTELLSSGVLKQSFIPVGKDADTVMKEALNGLEKGQIWHDAGEKTCFHLIEIVGMSNDYIEVSTNYVGTQGDEKPSKDIIKGKSKLISINEFKESADRYVLIKAA